MLWSGIVAFGVAAGLFVSFLAALGRSGPRQGATADQRHSSDDAGADVGPSERVFTAGREIGAVAGGVSLAATQVSAGTLVGAVGLHYAFGFGFVWTWVGIWLGWVVSATFVAPQLRARDGYTVPDFLAERFADGRQTIRVASAVVIAVVYLVFLTAQYVAGGVVLEAVAGVNRLTGAALVAVTAAAYTVLGGVRTSVYTDALQVATLVAGIGAVLAVGLPSAGGIGGLNARLAAADPALVAPVTAPVEVGGLAVAFGLGIVVAPYELSRTYAMRDPSTVRRAIALSVPLQAVVAVGIALVGLLARVERPGLSSPDAAVPALVTETFGPVAGGALVLAVLAAILSTADSVLVVSAAAVAHDLYEEALPALGVADRPSDRQVLRVARATTVAVALVPVGLTTVSGLLGTLVELIVALAAALLAGALFVPTVAGLYWPRATVRGAVAGVVAGPVAVATWHALTVSSTPLVGLATLDPVVPGLASSAVATVGGSLLDGPNADAAPA